MNIYEMYGRLSEMKLKSDRFVEDTLKMLQQVRDGVIHPSRIIVHESGWDISDIEKKPDEDPPTDG